MNVLLTCAGRRNYLIEYFKEALGNRGRVYAADVDPCAPAMCEADDAFVVPSVGDPDYVVTLQALCVEREIGLLLSLNDLELPLLAQHRAAFLDVGTVPIVSSPEVVRICADKLETARALTGWGLRTPQTFGSLAEAKAALSDGRLSFPVVVKPRWGTASIAVEFAMDHEELDLAYRMAEHRVQRSIIGPISTDPGRCVLVQEQLVGAEYGLDVVNDLGGRYMATFAKRKLAMRAGETDRAMTVADRRLESMGEVLGRRLGHIGNLDCDAFVVDGEYFVLELNPRFGGGYPFSYIAGSNVPACLLAWVSGKSHEDSWLAVRPGVMASKCDRLVERRDERILTRLGPTMAGDGRR